MAKAARNDKPLPPPELPDEPLDALEDSAGEDSLEQLDELPEDLENLTETDAANGLTPTEETRGRQGDQARPTCPQCSTPEKPVLLTAASTRSLFTWYGCDCGYRVKVPRPNINQVMNRRRRNQGEDFSAR